MFQPTAFKGSGKQYCAQANAACGIETNHGRSAVPRCLHCAQVNAACGIETPPDPR